MANTVFATLRRGRLYLSTLRRTGRNKALGNLSIAKKRTEEELIAEIEALLPLETERICHSSTLDFPAEFDGPVRDYPFLLHQAFRRKVLSASERALVDIRALLDAAYVSPEDEASGNGLGAVSAILRKYGVEEAPK